jgi:mannonate dehydratase
MEFRFSRRKMMQGVGAAALAQSAEIASAAAAARQWPIEDGPDTPKICLSPRDGGGPLPADLRPQTQTPGGAAGPPVPGGAGEAPSAGRGGFDGGFGGTLAPRPEAAQTAQAAAIPAGRGGLGGNPAAYQRIKQLGVTHLVGVGVGAFPWQEENIRRAVQTAKHNGMVAYNAMINIPRSIIYGRDGRDKDMELVVTSIEAAGKAGLPVIEYNFYAHRGIEGYYEQVGRANSGYTGFDYDLELLVDENGAVLPGILRDEMGRIAHETLESNPNAKRIRFRDLPPLASEGAHDLGEMWNNITYFLKAAVPAAEKAGVRLALHPNDPPAPISRGSQQIMGSVAGWKHLIEIVNSPANGITFDCGVTREMGEDPVEVAVYFASRKRINHMHYRNVSVVKPYEKYTEVFIDAGGVDMFGVMKAIVKNKYTGTIYPEHPRALDYDRERGRIFGYPGGGGYAGITFSVAYTRAMMQAALETV